MAKIYIGVDVEPSRLHVVSLRQGPEGLSVHAIASREYDDVAAVAGIVAQILQDWGVTTTRIAARLPSVRLLSRIVTFPFSDPGKIAAAVPLELAAQLPVELDAYHVTTISIGSDGDQFRSFALAVPDVDVEQFLAPFDRQELPLRVLEVAPFSDLYLLPESAPDAILVTIREAGYTVARSDAGSVHSYLQGMLTDAATDDDLAAEIVRNVGIVSAQVVNEALPVFLAGAGLTVTRQRALIERLPGALVPDVAFEEGRLQAAFLPALALARRAALPERKGTGNLRHGRHAFHGSLAPFRRQLIGISVLFVLALFSAACGFWFNYASKAGDIERLDQTLQAIYKQSFPRSSVPVDVPLYLASNLAGLREQSRLLGAARTGPLKTLEAITRGVGADQGIDVQELNFDVEGAALYGRAASFDAVDQLAARLRQQAVFAQVQIGDAKMSVDGLRVDFRVDLDFSATEGAPR